MCHPVCLQRSKSSYLFLPLLYSIPDFVPDILMTLSGHLHDPQPVPATIKEVVQDFKRTHHDDWEDHGKKFTQDQLDVLDELLVSESYFF